MLFAAEGVQQGEIPYRETEPVHVLVTAMHYDVAWGFGGPQDVAHCNQIEKFQLLGLVFSV